MKAEFKNEVQTTMRNQRNELKNDIKNMMSCFFQMQSPLCSGSLPSNIVAKPRGDLKAITTRSGVSYDGPTIPTTSSPLPKEVEREPKATKDKVQTTSSGSTAHIQPLVVQVPIPKPDVAPNPNPKPLHFDLSFADALLHMPKFASTFKSLISNKEKLFELANTLLNENCSAVLLKKLPEKLGDPDKFLIPCDFPELDECLALADLGTSINLMPISVWNRLSLPELTPTRMTLELTNRSVSYPVGVAEDVFVKVGKFHFPADFVIVDYDVDPRVPLILERPFLRTARELIDVHGEELTLRVNDEAITFNVGHTSRYSYRYDDELVNRIDVIDVTCEEYAQEVLRFSDSSKSGNPTPSLDPIITTSSPSLTPFEEGDFVLEEIEACLTSDSIPLGIDDADFDPEGDILLLEKLLNDDPSSPLPPKELHFKELKMIKSSIDDSPPLDVLGGNSVTFSNPLFDANDDFTSSDDESLLKEDVPEENFKIYSNPLFEFDDEYIFSGINPLFNEVLEDIENKDSYVSNLDELALLVTPLFDANKDEFFNPGGDIDEIDVDVFTDIKDGYHDSEGDIIYLESLFIHDTIPNLPLGVFLDHDLKSLNDEPNIDDLKIKENVRITFEDRHYFSLKCYQNISSFSYLSCEFFTSSLLRE
ncbi:reverse transcriptase domain-containing protein [Tanacetum coccineum]|uniref:Reverse transcriptase domain-containing protein n=1 Tax=Tanacetum coccineum TaxID=301880 RepID=A0ABQ5EEL4_9ASTR